MHIFQQFGLIEFVMTLFHLCWFWTYYSRKQIGTKWFIGFTSVIILEQTLQSLLDQTF